MDSCDALISITTIEQNKTERKYLTIFQSLRKKTIQQQQQQQHSSTQDDETTDLLSTSQSRANSNHLQHSPMKPASSNLVIATENPWKKLSNVRYKLDEHDANQRNQTHYHHIHAQHITFV